MKKLSAAVDNLLHGPSFALSRSEWVGCAGVLVMLVLGCLAEPGILSHLGFNARPTNFLAARLPERDDWREHWQVYATCAEFLLNPSSGAGARLDVDLDD